MERKARQENSEVTVEDIASVVSSWTGIPVIKACTNRNAKTIEYRRNSSLACHWSG